MNDSYNSSCGNWTDQENSTTGSWPSFRWYEPTTSEYVQAALYWIIFVVGVPGNLLVVAVVIWKLLKSPEYQAMTIFVGSLAVSDLGLLVWVTWINAVLSVNPEWLYGQVTCQMYVTWRSLTAHCSIATLMIIGLDRLMGLTKIGGGYFKGRMAAVWVGCCWVFNLILSAPKFFWTEVISTARLENHCTTTARGIQKSILHIFNVAGSIVTFYVPLAITWVSYGAILYRTHKMRKMVAPGASQASSNHIPTRMIVTCLTIAAIFTVCWVPVQITLLLISTAAIPRPLNAFEIARWLTIISCSNSCANPIIYGVMWRPFRAALREMYKSYAPRMCATNATN